MGRAVGSKRYFSKSDFKSGANRGGKPQGSCKQKIIEKTPKGRLCKSYQRKTIDSLFPWNYTSATFFLIIVLNVIKMVFGLKLFNPLCFSSQFLFCFWGSILRSLLQDLFSLHLTLVDLDVIKKLYLQHFLLLLITRGQVWTFITQTDLLSKLAAIEGVKWHW